MKRNEHNDSVCPVNSSCLAYAEDKDGQQEKRERQAKMKQSASVENQEMAAFHNVVSQNYPIPANKRFCLLLNSINSLLMTQPCIQSIGTAVPSHKIPQQVHHAILENANGMSRIEK